MVEEKIGTRPGITVLVPAHNEELLIGETINSVKRQLVDGDRLLVVADNCSDNTAKLARSLGAEVIERVDTERRGKGYALNFGIGYLRSVSSVPEVLLVVDADCNVEDGSLDKLARRCVQYDCPVQALYLLHSHSESPGQKIAEFALVVKNLVRPLGYAKLDLPCQLMGTGMAFPFELIGEESFSGSNIVEDMKLGIDMARKGHMPMFCPEARVTSSFPVEVDSIESQRTRWEHGHLSMLLSESPGLLVAAIKRHDLRLLAMTLDLIVPPLALFAISLLITSLISLFAGIAGYTSFIPLAIMLFACSLFALAVMLAWWGFARHILTLRGLARIPAYILSKLPVYIRFWTRRQREWIRTNRD